MFFLVTAVERSGTPQVRVRREPRRHDWHPRVSAPY
jgi:hypothetical protein